MTSAATHVDVPPPPLDDPTILNPLDCPALNWGLIGCGRVCHDFAQALKHLPTASIVACAARELDRAQEFSIKHGIPKAYGGYDELLQDANVQCVYVGNIHCFRRSIGEKCLLANKHVLLEKPFTCNAADAQYLIELARERNLFLMEGMWTRFFPAVEQARLLVLGDDKRGLKPLLGDVAVVLSDFNFNASDSEEYPTSFVYNRRLGGSASLLTGPYPLAAATLFFQGRLPDVIKVAGQVDSSTGVDLQAAVTLSFPGMKGRLGPSHDPECSSERTPKLPGAGVALLSYGMLCESEETTTVVGTKGRLSILNPGHCPTRLKIVLKDDGRGRAVETREYHYPVPTDTDDIVKAGGFYYPNSAGFSYEAAAVARCIAAGKTEAPQHTLMDTLVAMRILDEIRNQLGFKGVHEE